MSESGAVKKEDMLKLAVISVYYGKLPVFFRTWLRSAQMNPTVDFYIVTDIEIDCLPDNVKIIPLTFEELHLLAEKKLGRPVVLHRYYKLCDYKPMYGIILEDYLKGYDYWAHCDMDLIFGDIRKFTEKYEIEKYQKFLHLGHLSFYRNTAEGNSVFKLDGAKFGNWKDVVSTKNNCLFDEYRGILQIYNANGISMFSQRIFADITHIHHRFCLSTKDITQKKDINYRHQIFYWQNGGVYRAYCKNGELHEEEYIYIHFKKRDFSKESFNVFEENAFFITPDGFFVKNAQEEVTISDIEKYNSYPGKIKEICESLAFETAYYKKRIIKKSGILKN